MSNSNLLIYSVFLFFSFASSSYFNTTFEITTTAHTHQCSALLHFKQNLSSFNKNFSMDFPPYYPCEDWLGSEGYYPIMMNWNTSTTDCCYWDGVTCNHSTGDIIGLDLSCGMLQGTLHPNTSLFNLPHLQTLNLAFNDFTGSQIPPEIERFSNTLTHLNISVCGFSGQIPAEITLLHKLVSLDLSWSYDLSLVPRVFINLLQNHTCLEEISLGGVDISSVLPTHLNISSSSSLKSLNLYDTGLHGKLPHYIFNLQYLENLNLSFNSFTGQIPWEISLPKLVSLSLSGNDNLRIKPYIFNSLLQNSTLLRYLGLVDVNIGEIPGSIGQVKSLIELDLSNCGLTGSIPKSISNLRHLTSLDLSSNKLKGTLPSSIGNLSHLTSLDLSSNKLNGTLPSSIGNLSHLTSLDLSSNKLNGTLPSSIGNLRHLTSLDLSSNKLNGTLPSSIGNLTHLTDLYLSDNELNGTLPSSIGNLRHLTSLDLSSNKLNGTLPSSISSLQSLETLSLADNQFDGQIDVLMFQQLTNLVSLDLSHNNFSGDWELSSLTNLFSLNLSYSGLSVTTSNANHHVPNLMSLNLASCKIKGPFLPSICNMSNLLYLDLSNNSLDGVIPQCFGNIISSFVIMINVGTNRFQGTIPNVYENCGRLEGLILNGNQFEGEVPSSLSKCQYLKVLDMGDNHLNGTFPTWLESLPNLQVLVLKSNSFHGHIVPSSTVGLRFPALQVIDLSHNGFEGQLPRKYFQNFNAMKNSTVKRGTTPKYLFVGIQFYSFVVTVKGVEQDFLQLYVYYTIVCLSHNNFVGEIPDIIGNLNSLVVLDLSHNSLTSQIPHTLGKLSEIESLDLSCNQLTGKIPQSLADLTSLEFLNLSQNHLMGLIPVGKQLNTFLENSFEGNPNLCGRPLPKKCNDNPQDPPLERDGDGDEEESGFTWRVVMLGYGCGTLFGLVMGYLMLSTGRPMWFNAIADALEQMILKRRNKRRYVYIGR